MVGGFFKQTRREKRAHSAALNLFFGALLGANLGTLAGLSLHDYTYLVVLLVGTVTTIHLAMASERRGYIAILLLLYGGLLLLLYLRPSLRPTIAEEDQLKQLATLAIWFAAVAFVKLTPTLEPPPGTPPGEPSS